MPATKSTKAPRKLTHHRTVIGRAQRARTEAKIIAVAIQVFARSGPFIPVIDDFVAAAGISRGTFYNYFPTTQALLEATVAAVSNKYINAINRAVAHLKSPILRYTTASRLYYRHAETDSVFANFISAATQVRSLAGAYASQDMREAIEQKLISVPNEEAALTVAVGTMEFAVRRLAKKRGRQRMPGTEVMRLILRAWNVEPGLIEEALAIPLPKLQYRAND